MEFPRGNKIHRALEDKVGDNAALLDELLNRIQWRRFFNYYCAFFGIFLVSLFLLIVVIRAALFIF